MDLEPITEPHPSSSSSTSSTSSSSYAFVSHSHGTLSFNFPASIGNNAPFARRRRRRRTSPHDQVVLEEEYGKCTKPDKARRKEICKMVQMGEKEVQIWFCNRRQAQRRRATPLQPHEMVPNSSRSMSRFASSQLSLVSSSPRRSSNSDPASESSVSSGFPISSSPYQLVSALKPASHHLLHSEDSDHHHAVTRNPESELQSDHHQEYEDDCEQFDASESQKQLIKESKSQQTTFTYTTHTAMTAAAATTATSTTTKTTATQETKMTTSAHRRLQDVLNGSGTPEQQPTLPPPPPIRSSSNPRRTNSANPLPPPRLLRRSSSAVRLTTSLEGKATVILEDEPTSSPPKPPPTPAPRTTKRRPLITPVDSKLWEFCCDNQSAIQSPARIPPQPSEATQALRLLRTRRNTVNNGSGVPSLPRTQSQSQSTTQQPKPAKQQPPPSASKRMPAKKQERKVITSTKKASRPKPLSSNSNTNKTHGGFSPSIDSDKENQPPGAPVSPPPEPKRRPRVQGVSGKGGMMSSTSTPSKKNGKGKPTPRKKRSSTYSDNAVGFYEDETQELVGSQDGDFIAVADGDSGSPRRIDEMECVENLLSLRGGTWR